MFRLSVEALEDRWVPSTVYVNASATGGNTGADWADAFTSLQSALAAAQPGDQVWVAQGTYKPTSTTDRNISFALRDGVNVYGGFAGFETDLSQRNVQQNATTLSGDLGQPGNTDNSYHVLTAIDLTSTTLDGFTITGGNANNGGGYAFEQADGGGLYINSGTS